MRFVVIIPARYASSRFPGKPLADLNGQPMIQRVYGRARQVPGLERVIVATDDARIQAAVVGFGGDVVLTSPAHRTGTDRIAEVAATLDVDVIVNVQGDLPLLDPSVVDAAVAPLRVDAGLPMATIKTPITTIANASSNIGQAIAPKKIRCACRLRR